MNPVQLYITVNSFSGTNSIKSNEELHVGISRSKTLMMIKYGDQKLKLRSSCSVVQSGLLVALKTFGTLEIHVYASNSITFDIILHTSMLNFKSVKTACLKELLHWFSICIEIAVNNWCCFIIKDVENCKKNSKG